jgi:3-methyladenine DNA glycosylase AlkD
MMLVQIIKRLEDLADPDKIRFKEKKYAIRSENALGVYMKDLKALAKEIGRNDSLALELFDSGIYEARLLCSKIYTPQNLTEELMEKWVRTFDNWEICDSFCMSVFARSPLAVKKAEEWSSREKEFEKRAGFVIMAAYCMADKKAANEVYLKFLPIIKREATDERIYVKKAVNWALRSIGKRNIDLNKEAIATAEAILKIESKAAKWIAKDALRELTKENVNILDYPRAVYRPA